MSKYCFQIFLLFSVMCGIFTATQWGDICPKANYPGPNTSNLRGSRIKEDSIKCFVMVLNSHREQLKSTSNWKTLGCTDKAVVIFHGTGENSTHPWVINLQRAYAEQHKICAVACDYHYASHTFYLSAIRRGDPEVISNVTAKLINDVIIGTGEVDISKGLSLVGFSWGAQISGLVAKKLLKYSGKIPFEIIGLDPAGLGYNLNPASRRLAPDDAVCVVVYYTSNKLGTSRRNLGKRNIVWGQCGRNQYPVCQGDTVCDHVTSHEYFIDVLKQPTMYEGHRCEACPYRRPEELTGEQYGELYSCENETVPILTGSSCEPETVYILPTGCVPPNV